MSALAGVLLGLEAVLFYLCLAGGGAKQQFPDPVDQSKTKKSDHFLCAVLKSAAVRLESSQ